MSMRGLGCVLMLVALTGSYGLAGAVTATLMLSQALTDPWLGRLADRRGQRRLLVLALAAHSSGTLLLVLAAQAGAPARTLVPAAALSGAAVLPVGSLVRARWAGLVGGTPALDTAFALESVLDEAVFVVGPVLVTALAVGVAPARRGCWVPSYSSLWDPSTWPFRRTRSRGPRPSTALPGASR